MKNNNQFYCALAYKFHFVNGGLEGLSNHILGLEASTIHANQN